MTKIIQRHDTAANWSTINPVLALGEMGVETDTHKFKFGDGTTAYNELPYAAGEGSSGSGTILTSLDGTITYDKLAIGNTLLVAKGNEYIYSPYITFSNEPTNGTFTGGDGRYAKVLIQEYNFNTANSWEFQTKITWGTVRTYAAVMGLYNNSDFHNPVLIYEQDRLGMFLSSNGSGWDIAQPSQSSLVPISGQTYYIKMGFTGSQYYFKYNTTGWSSGFTTAQSVNNTNKVYTEGQVQFALLNGFLTANNYYNDSTMYLEDTALILDEVEIFRGANHTSQNTLDSSIKISSSNAIDTTHFELKNGTFDNINNTFTCTGTPGLILKPDVANTTTIVLKTRWRFATNTTGYKSVIGGGSGNTTFPNIDCYQGYDLWFPDKQSIGTFPGDSWRNLTLTINRSNGSLTFYQEDDNGNITDNWTGYNTGTGRDTSIIWSIHKYNGTHSDVIVDLSSLVLIEDGVEYPYDNNVEYTIKHIVIGSGLQASINSENYTSVISGQDVKTFEGYSNTGTLVLKSINGVIQWVAEA